MNRRLLVALVLPVIALGAWTAKHAFIKVTGTRVELPIVGFDPRDLLSGHYMLFRIDYGVTGKFCEWDGEACMCLTPSDGGLWKGSSSTSSCSIAAKDCQAFIRGTCTGDRFETGIERYYFSEAHVKKLAVVPPKSSVVLRLGSGGVPVVDEVRVDGAPIEDFLDRDP
jgi:uncharacterized membrane-anchored protein